MYEYHGIHNLLWFLIVGGVAGWLASVLVQGGGMGIIADIFVGILGAFLGEWLNGFFGLQVWGFWGGFFMWVLGAVILLVLFRAISGRRAKKQ
jgi:uncharacterized membrane protein YeaQ/YmgE (transglycosylase-associated protein family)